MIDLSTVTDTVVDPAGTRLLDANCRPKVTEGTRVQFSFYLHSCGTTSEVVLDAVHLTLTRPLTLPPACGFQVDNDTATYENEVFFTELVGRTRSERYAINCPGCNCPAAASLQVAFSFQVDCAVQLSSGGSRSPLYHV